MSDGAARQLLGCYLYQGWTFEFANYPSAVHRAIADSGEETTATAIDELERVLRSGRSEAELVLLLHEDLACDLNPAGLDMTASEFLADLIGRLQAGLESAG